MMRAITTGLTGRRHYVKSGWLNPQRPASKSGMEEER